MRAASTAAIGCAVLALLTSQGALADTPRSRAFGACGRGGFSKEKLRSTLSAWVAASTSGGSVYINRGYLAGQTCTVPRNMSQDTMRRYLRAQGAAASGDLRETFQREIVGRINRAGVICGDCVTWMQRMTACAGRTGPTLNSIKEGSTHLATASSCSAAAAGVRGGIQFGDLFWFKPARGAGIPHMFMYTGGAGLPYEIVEMSGGTDGCGRPAGLRGMGCVKSHRTKGGYARWSPQFEFCRVYRILPGGTRRSGR